MDNERFKSVRKVGPLIRVNQEDANYASTRGVPGALLAMVELIVQQREVEILDDVEALVIGVLADLRSIEFTFSTEAVRVEQLRDEAETALAFLLKKYDPDTFSSEFDGG